MLIVNTQRLLFFSFVEPLRLREFNEDGSLKDALSLLTENGFEVGQLVERKGDRMKCFIESASESIVKLSLDGTRDIFINVPMVEFLDKKWSVKRVNEQVSVTLIPKPNSCKCADFQIAKYRAMIQLELCHMTVGYEDVVQHVQICVKPTRGVMVTKQFLKGKLTLVPTTLKVVAKGVKEDVPKSAVVVKTPYHDAVFCLSNVSLPKSADEGIAVPFWFLGRGEEDKQNMEIVHIKLSGDLIVPVARNTKQLKDGDMLYLPKAEDQSSSSTPPVKATPPKKPTDTNVPKKKARKS